MNSKKLTTTLRSFRQTATVAGKTRQRGNQYLPTYINMTESATRNMLLKISSSEVECHYGTEIDVSDLESVELGAGIYGVQARPGEQGEIIYGNAGDWDFINEGCTIIAWVAPAETGSTFDVLTTRDEPSTGWSTPETVGENGFAIGIQKIQPYMVTPNHPEDSPLLMSAILQRQAPNMIVWRLNPECISMNFNGVEWLSQIPTSPLLPKPAAVLKTLLDSGIVWNVSICNTLLTKQQVTKLFQIGLSDLTNQ